MSAPVPYWSDGQVTLPLGKCETVLPGLPANSVDAIVTDPPYGLGFMGKKWDSPGKSFVERKADKRNTFDHVGGNHNPVDSADSARTQRVENRKFQAWCETWAVQCLRVLRPGGFMLAFGGTRTWHRLACAIEDAGFEIRDSTADLTGQDAPGLIWAYGSGFPKSLNAGRAVDMHVCEIPGRHCANQIPVKPRPGDHVCLASPLGEQWRGHGTAAKPAWEPIVVARKPMAGTLAANLLRYGTGALNVAACRVEHNEPPGKPSQ